MTKKIIITQEGLEKLKKELDELKNVRRPDIISRIKVAKDLGDLSENAEYTAAKEEQSFIEGRVQELEQTIKNAKVAENGNHDPKQPVNVGRFVEVEIEGDKDKFEIVGPAESDPTNGKISSDSPVGKSLMGRLTGEKVTVQTPDGQVVYKILSVK